MIIALVGAVAAGILAARAVQAARDLTGRWVAESDGNLYLARDLAEAGTFEVRGAGSREIFTGIVSMLGRVELAGRRGRRVGRRLIVWRDGDRWYRQGV